MLDHTKALAAVTEAIRGTIFDDPTTIGEIGRKPHMLFITIDPPVESTPDAVGEAMAKTATALARGGYYLHNLDMIPDAYAVDPAIILLDVRALMGLAPDLDRPSVRDFIQHFTAQFQPIVTEENIAKLRADGFDDLADALLKGWDRITRMHSRAAAAGILSEVSWPRQRMVENVWESVDTAYDLAVGAGATGIAALDALYEDKEGIRDGREYVEVPGWNDRPGPVVPATKRKLFPEEYKSHPRPTARRRTAAKARTMIKRAALKARTKTRDKGGRA